MPFSKDGDGRSLSWAVSIALLAATPVWAFSSGRRNQANPGNPDIPLGSIDAERRLSETVESGASGLGFEREETQARLREQARAFGALVAGGKAGERAQFAHACRSDPAANPFCEFVAMVNPEEELGRSARPRRQARSGGGDRKLARAIAAADLETISRYPDRDVFRAVRKLTSLERIRKIGEKVSSGAKCRFPALALMLGNKAEELLPREGVRELAIRLYEHASACSGEAERSVRAGYRASILHIWADNCAGAKTHLETLASLGAGWGDYRTRALYWQVRCGLRHDPGGRAPAAREQLISEYPFSLHSLLALGAEESPAGTDSTIRFRSARAPSLNPKLLAIEALLAGGHLQHASAALRRIEAEIQASAEPEVRLYASVLQDRAFDDLSKFRTLAGLFRDHPQTVSTASLRLYYPKREREIGLAARQGLDPFLVLSLIRQESAFNRFARSTAGALGLMQVMPRTARRIERIGARELFDPEKNMRIGSRYFSRILARYGGDTELALAAYNAGPQRVDEWRKRYPVADLVLFMDLIPFKETREYVASIARNYYWYRKIYGPATPEQGFSVFGARQ